MQLSGAAADPLDGHIPRMCCSTMARAHNPEQGQEEATFALCGFLSASKSSRVVKWWSASFSIVEIKCWDHAGDGNIPQILHGVY